MFTDVHSGGWFYDAVKEMNTKGIFGGITENQFAPNNNVTRAMLVTLLWRMDNQPVVNYLMSFDDVSEDQYYAEAVRWAASNYIVGGYSDTKFAPNQMISKEKIAVMMQRYASYKGMDTTGKADLDAFADSTVVSVWAKNSMQWAIQAGLILGKNGNCLDPIANATRAETAAILQRFLEMIK